jgi:hypothetical protein
MYNKNARDELSSETVMIMHIILYKCLSTIKGNITINITEKNAGPDVQQLPGGGARRHILFVFFQCILLGLSYLTLCPYHFFYILFLGPCILFHFLRGWGSTPPATTRGSSNISRFHGNPGVSQGFRKALSSCRKAHAWRSSCEVLETLEGGDGDGMVQSDMVVS